MITAPASIRVPERTKAEDLAYLEQLKGQLNGQHLEVSRAPMISHSYKTLICFDSIPYTMSSMQWERPGSM